MWFLLIKKNKKYRSASLLPIASKIFEKPVYNNSLNYTERENLLNINQSGFRANDSCINQLNSATHAIRRALNCSSSLEFRGTFLDLSKTFDKVWHQGFLFKLESFGIRGEFLNLSIRFQRVLLNDQESSWLPITAAVPQGSFLNFCCFYYILIIYLMGSIPQLKCLPMIRYFFLLSEILMNQLSI